MKLFWQPGAAHIETAGGFVDIGPDRRKFKVTMV